MYTNTMSCVRVNGLFDVMFGGTVGVYLGSVLSLLLFIIIIEALSSGTLWQLPMGTALR